MERIHPNLLFTVGFISFSKVRVKKRELLNIYPRYLVQLSERGDRMLTTKSRLHGDSVVVTLPPDNGKVPKENQEYSVIYSDDGTITLVPKIDDPFSGGDEAEYYEKDEWSDVSPEGRESI